VDTLKNRLKSMETQMKSCKEKLEEANVPANQPIDSLRSCLNALDDKINNLKAEQEATSRSLQQDQKRVAQLSTETENQCPLCLQPLNDKYKEGMLQRIQAENVERQKTVAQLQSEILELQRTRNMASEAFSNLQELTSRSEDLQTRINDEEKILTDLSKQLMEKQNIGVELRGQFEALRFEISRFDMSDLESARAIREQAFRRYYLAESDLRTKESRKKDLTKRIDEVKERIDFAQQKLERIQKIGKILGIIGAIRDAYRSIQPKLRREFVKVLRNFVQQVLDSLVGESPLLNVMIDETYTPYVKSESGAEREVGNLSGGERTLLAFAYRLGLGQLIMQSRTGHGLSMLLLDEPTESLGREDGSIDRLAEAISRFRAIEQIIAVTHSEAFAEKAEHVITLEKEAGVSKVSITA
jgi:DNA repair exonuclease SbcCD ATPase subunit